MREIRILRVLNTNAVMIKDDDGKEMVLLGPGLGFKKRPGDKVDLALVEKAFHLTDKNYQKRFRKLIDSIPESCIMVAEQIIEYGKKTYHFKLSEVIHLSLADHLKQALDSFRDGYLIPNTLTHEIKNCYRNEFKTAQYGLEMIQKEFGLALPEDEAGFIAMHIISAEYADENSNARRIIDIVASVNRIVEEELEIRSDEHSLAYCRYITHLNYLAERILMDTPPKRREENEFLRPLTVKYATEYHCAQKVADYIQTAYGYRLSSDEILYMVLHLAHLT